METIFVITAIQDENLFIHGISRQFGWFPTFELADEYVKNNRGDIYENRYKYVVIEEVGPGIHPMVKNEYWYEVCYTKYKILFDSCSIPFFEIIDKPKVFENTFNFGIG
jgi:hypothetical protein